MSWMTRARLWLAGTAFKAADLTIAPRWIRSSFLEPSFDRLISDAYRANSAFLACAATLAFAFPEPPLVPYTEEGEEGEPILDHPLRFLLRRPNPRMGEREMMATTMAYMALGGNAYWHKVRNGNGTVFRLWPYHAGQMAAVPGGDEWISHYEYDSGSGQKDTVPVEDVVHFRWPLPDPDQPWQAIPPLVAAAREVDMDNEARRYVYALLKNDAVPRVALQMPEHVEVSDEDERRLKAGWRQKYGGDNRGDIAILTGGATLSRAALDMDELAYDTLSRIPEARIAAVMRVPAILAGLNVGLDRSTFSNYGEARAAFTEDTLVPLWELFASEVDANLATEWSDTIDVRFDTGRVKALSENTDAMWSRVDRAVNRGLLTVNEARTALGYTEIDGGDIFLWGFNTLPQPATALMQVANYQPPQLPDDDNEPKSTSPRGTKANVRESARRLQRIRRSLISEMANELDAYFDQLADEVEAAARQNWKAGAGSSETKALPRWLVQVMEAAKVGLDAILRSFYTEVIRASWQEWGDVLEDETPFSMRNPAVIQALSRSAQRVTAIDETTRSVIQDVLETGRENGWSIDQLVQGDDGQDGLRAVVEETYKNRAQAIARTELGTAQNVASVERYRQTGVAQVRIFDNGFDNSHPRCRELDGTTQTLDWINESDENILQHPNCVRAFGPVFEEG